MNETVGFSQCERIVVTTADGRVYDLGSPHSLLFKSRLKRYQLLRRREMKEKNG